jgi:hypothetical protein
LRHEADQFWDRLDAASREALRRSVRGGESPGDAVDTLVAHPWARFFLLKTGPARVRVLNQALDERVRRELAAESVARSPSLEARVRDLIVVVVVGRPDLAIEQLERLGGDPAMTESLRRRVDDGLAAARILDFTLKGRVREAAQSIDAAMISRHPCLDPVRKRLLDCARKRTANPDVELWLEQKSDLAVFLAVELWRARRRLELGDFGPAIGTYNTTVDTILTLAWRRRGAPPDDALTRYRVDEREVLRTRGAVEPAALPADAHGPLEMFVMLRAFGVAGMHELSRPELKSCERVLRHRNDHAHRASDDTQESADRAAAVAELLVPRLAVFLGIPVIDETARRELVLPQAFVEHLRAPL